MADKQMLIIDIEVANAIDNNRGDLSRSEFLKFLIDSQLKERDNVGNRDYVDKGEFRQFAQGIRELMRNFLEFFLSYSVELGNQPQDKSYMELSQKLRDLGSLGKKADNSD